LYREQYFRSQAQTQEQACTPVCGNEMKMISRSIDTLQIPEFFPFVIDEGKLELQIRVSSRKNQCLLMWKRFFYFKKHLKRSMTCEFSIIY
jgi:hypothetical protein